MRLKRAVTIKAIVTEDFKRNLQDELNRTLVRVDAATQDLEAQLRRYIPEIAKTDLEQAGRLRRELETERQRHLSARAEIQDRLKEVSSLEIGSEFAQGTVESDIEVSVGDHLFDKLTDAEIVVKDGVVQEIREG